MRLTLYFLVLSGSTVASNDPLEYRGDAWMRLEQGWFAVKATSSYVQLGGLTCLTPKGRAPASERKSLMESRGERFEM